MDTRHLLFVRRAARAAFALSLVSALAACGDDEDNNPPDDGDTSTDVSGDATGDDAGDDTTPDVGVDTTPDVGEDTTPDVGEDTPDIGVDTTPDVGEDTLPDIGDDTADVGTDTADVGTDTADVGTDTADVGTDTADVGTDTATDVAMDGDTGVVDDPGLVFGDDYAPGVSFAEFGGSINTLSVDMVETYSGDGSLRIDVPATSYTGGALVGSAPRDLTGFNALTFAARSSAPATLNTTGFGNDSADNVFQVELRGLALDTTWQEFTIPIPDPAVATSIAGLFHFAEGSDEGEYTIWLDEIRFVTLDDMAIGTASAAFATLDQNLVVGQTTSPVGLVANYTNDTTTVQTFPMPVWFSWMSSNTDVATVDDFGVATALAEGTATITGMLAGEAAGGAINLTVTPGPTSGPDAPGTLAEDVDACLFSDVYPQDPVNTYRTDWSAAGLLDLVIGGDNVKLYTNLDFAGIETLGDNSLDLTGATMMHVDVWTANATQFGVKLVDAGANNAIEGPGTDDREGEVFFTADSTPALTQGAWVSLEVPLADFAAVGLETRANVSQIIISGRVDGAPGVANIYIDNFYFY